MSALDWVLFAAYLAVVVALGVRASRASTTSEGFFVADRSMPWWAIGLSVMATQASAITFIGTTGLAYAEGMRFAQFYFGMPVAMAILAFTLVPLYHRARVLTAYELLGRRFDEKTRRLTAVLFLVSRGLALGVVIYAPSVVLSLLLGWDLAATIGLMAAVAILYTMLGGLRAVIWTDVLQMGVVLVGLGLCLATMLARLPDGVGLREALSLAELTGRTRVLDGSFDPADKYTVWSGLLGGTFLFLAYFGCDQSQVQRFLSGRSLRDDRLALLMNAVLKVPLQLFVLLVGVVLFVVLHFLPTPVVFDPGADAATLASEHESATAARADAARAWLAAPDEARRAAYLAAQAEVDALRARVPDADDVNHVFPWFVIRFLPAGLVGLLVAAIFAAAMSSVDSELNALATATVVDLWRPLLAPRAADDRVLAASRWITVGWGALAAGFALYAGALGSVIEAVNAIGSYFYGSLLGVFVLAFATRSANGHGAFAGLLAGMAAVWLASRAGLAWLWLNPVGAVVVVAVGLLVSRLTRGRASGRAAGTA